MRVLVVDDNAALAENLGELLEAFGFHPIVLTGAPEALRLAEREPFDAALLDVHLPGLDGVALLEALRMRRPDARFVLMTAFGTTEREGMKPRGLPGMPGAMVRARRCGAPLLVKPFALDAMFRALGAPGVQAGAP